jgi:hypothetical protein
MPLEIKELHIRVSVNQPQQGQQANAVSAARGKKEEDEKEALVSQCVEEILDMIKKKKER